MQKKTTRDFFAFWKALRAPWRGKLSNKSVESLAKDNRRLRSGNMNVKWSTKNRACGNLRGG